MGSRIILLERLITVASLFPYPFFTFVKQTPTQIFIVPQLLTFSVVLLPSNVPICAILQLLKSHFGQPLLTIVLLFRLLHQCKLNYFFRSICSLKIIVLIWLVIFFFRFFFRVQLNSTTFVGLPSVVDSQSS